jgi:PAS domain S-box-containing protein
MDDRLEREGLALALEAGEIGLFEADLPDGEPRVNAKLREIMGFAEGQRVTAADVSALVIEEDRARRAAAHAKACQADGYFHCRYRIRRASDGALRAIDSRGRMFFDKGRPVHVVGVNRDITDEVETENALAEKARLAERLTVLAGALPGAIYSFVRRLDGSSFFSYAAPQIEALLGFGPETYSRDLRALAERVHPDDIGGLSQSVGAAARKAPWQALFRYDHPKKGEIWIEGHSQRAPESDGEIGWHGYLQDVTGRVNAARALSESEARVSALKDERLAALEKLAAGLAHEVNQPLAAGATLLYVARKRLEALRARREEGEADAADFAKATEALEKAADQIVRAGRTLSRVREFSRRGEPDKTYRSLHETVHEALAALAADASLAIFDIELRLEAARDQVLIDRLQIIELLVSLIQNARQATGPDDRYMIGIASRNQRDSIEITVMDWGAGLSETARAHLFELFWTSKSSAMGVGLAMARGIVEAHAGRLWAEDNPAGGAIFTFSLPLVERNEGQEDVK